MSQTAQPENGREVPTLEATKLAVFGAEGSFSEQAALSYAEREGLNLELEHHDTVGAVMDAVGRSACLGVIPIANTLGGLVRASFEAMGSRTFLPRGQISLDINHCLVVARPGLGRQDITQVVSHPQALVQCERFLDRDLPGVPRLEWSDTASAAKSLAEGVLEATSAVIASPRAAALFRLSVWKENIQDSLHNKTTFLVIGAS